MKSRYSTLSLVLLVLAGFVHAQIHVDDNAPGDPQPFDRQVSDPEEDGSAAHPFDSIQEAIDAAKDGDIIVVAPGHYLSPDPWTYDEVNFRGKSIQLISSAPTDFSVTERTLLCGVVIFEGRESSNCLLQGFKIQNHTCGGILGNDTEASVSHCIISGNGPCGATVVKDMRGELRNCLIVDNATFHGCGVQPVVSGCMSLVNCTIANNISGVGIEGALSSVLTRIHNCIIYGNQGEQIIPSGPALPETFSPGWMADMRYSLVQDSAASVVPIGWPATNFDSDPCFVQPGYWVGAVLVEGDYHLKSQGYRWSEQEIHGSHWYYDDSSTSWAIDAGDPVFGLGEELERAPDDPEGRWGVNHAMNCGAYGGTTQASLAPNRGRPLGVAGVDLRDYLPLAVGNSWIANTLQSLTVQSHQQVNGYDVDVLVEVARNTWRTISCAYVDDTLYTIVNAVSLNWLPDTSLMTAMYPQILPVGSMIEAPGEPFPAATARRPALVTRGTLAEVLDGTEFDPDQFVVTPVSDIIAIREKKADGTLGEPTAIFARGFGPLLLGGLPVTEATIDNVTYYARRSGPPSRR